MHPCTTPTSQVAGERARAEIANWLICLGRQACPLGSWAMVEVGVKQGQLAEMLLCWDSRLSYTGVDRWCPPSPIEPYVLTGDPAAMATMEDHEGWYQDATERLRLYSSRATLHRTDSVSAAKTTTVDATTLVFLDADHTERARHADLEAWAPAVQPGGFLAGGLWRSSFGGQGCERAVRRFLIDHSWKCCVQHGPSQTWAIQKPRDEWSAQI
ncbi:hypothetical protein LCGC14_1484170 [marine sediment metagenome]|uniref:Class I SAM-dependent methyltransferase n=1 Tax=marine sediment metagenome TaxID=412755 RepID=A0A0F9JUH4_9ZZZZ